MSQISNKDFSILWGEALATGDRDYYISEWSTSIIWGPQEEMADNDLLTIAAYLGKLWDAAHMTVRELCTAAGLTQTDFAVRFCIPKRTVEDWCAGKRTPPDYLRLMIADAIGLLPR